MSNMVWGFTLDGEQEGVGRGACVNQTKTKMVMH
jgi:hypothetical protein